MSFCADGEVAFYPVDAEGAYTQRLCVKDGVSSAMSIVASDENLVDYTSDQDSMWLLICGAMVFFMQCGFSMLEAGSVSDKNTVNILYKNLLDAALGAICFWLFGYAFAYGDTAGGFIGTTNFGLTSEGEAGAGWDSWFFQWAFAATAATIVSGAVAERTKFSAYLVYSVVLTTFIYPVVVHWGWGDGWLSAWRSTPAFFPTGTTASNGLIDFAGSGIVHMVGGGAGLVGAAVVGPRVGRFGEPTKFWPRGAPRDMPGHSVVLQAFGTIILFFGWFGFNGGSTLCTVGCMDLGAKVITNTVLSAAAATITTTVFVKVTTGRYGISQCLNGLLAGLVSITAPCPVVEPPFAILIGIIGALVFLGSEKLLLFVGIDDVLSASPIHFFAGFWGVVSVGLFATDANIEYAAYPNTPNTAMASGEQIYVQFVGALAIAAWTLGTSLIMFLGIKYTIGMRVPDDIEKEGLDISEHGAQSYVLS